MNPTYSEIKQAFDRLAGRGIQPMPGKSLTYSPDGRLVGCCAFAALYTQDLPDHASSAEIGQAATRLRERLGWPVVLGLVRGFDGQPSKTDMPSYQVGRQARQLIGAIACS